MFEKFFTIKNFRMYVRFLRSRHAFFVFVLQPANWDDKKSDTFMQWNGFYQQDVLTCPC